MEVVSIIIGISGPLLAYYFYKRNKEDNSDIKRLLSIIKERADIIGKEAVKEKVEQETKSKTKAKAVLTKEEEEHLSRIGNEQKEILTKHPDWNVQNENLCSCGGTVEYIGNRRHPIYHIANVFMCEKCGEETYVQAEGVD